WPSCSFCFSSRRRHTRSKRDWSSDVCSSDLAGSLEQDVTIYYLCETGSEDAIITGLLDQYAAAGSHIRWQQIDPAVYPTFAARYGAETVSTGSLRSEERRVGNGRACRMRTTA